MPRFPRYASAHAARQAFRDHLASADALVALSLLGAVAGLVTGVVIVAFRLLTESSLVWVGLMPNAEAYESLSWHWRLALPTVGGLLIGLLFQLVPKAMRQVGPVHVMMQLARNGGRLPWGNAVMQFIGGGLSIIAGHSVGREGPVIHMGAASASLMGQWMHLPNNSIRTLVACGVAGSIAASFNTPIAGVVFAMEVVMLEYTLLGFAPVILAAVSATSVSRLVYGPDPAFAVPSFQLASLLELPYVLVLGLIVGCLAAAYVYGTRRLDERSRHFPLWLRTTAAGAFTGLCALIAPEIMGLGYDTVQLAVLGQIGLLAMISITLFKLLATVACGGLGLPGGLIGPMVVMGATAGGALGVVGQWLALGPSSPPGFYAALGMVAMMGASLQAPLAALMAILELTANPNTMLPGMVAVITAFLVARAVFGQDPIFISILRGRGVDYRFDPVALALERTAVRAVMSRSFVVVDVHADSQARAAAMADSPDWLLLVDGPVIHAVVATRPVPSLAPGTTGETLKDSPVAADPTPVSPPGDSNFSIVAPHATLREALAKLDEQAADIVLVSRDSTAQPSQARGVVTRQQIESGVRYKL